VIWVTVAFPFAAAFVEIAPGLYAVWCTGLDMFVVVGGIPFASQRLKNKDFIAHIMVAYHTNSSYPPSSFLRRKFTDCLLSSGHLGQVAYLFYIGVNPLCIETGLVHATYMHEKALCCFRTTSYACPKIRVPQLWS